MLLLLLLQSKGVAVLKRKALTLRNEKSTLISKSLSCK